MYRIYRLRVIDGFEHHFQLVALASLMPIVAGIGGNTGNQTITMIVRNGATAYSAGKLSFLILREMGVALINGIVWGGIMGPLPGGCMTIRSRRRDDPGDDAQLANGGDDGRDYPDGDG